MPEFKNLQGDACFRVPKRKKTSATLIQSFKPTTVNDTRRQIEDYCRDLIINNDHISQMEQRMRAAIEKGLNKDTHQFASVKCFPTYVRDLPTGTEYGKFLALDLGGTNFRVVLIDIGPNEKYVFFHCNPLFDDFFPKLFLKKVLLLKTRTYEFVP